MQLHAYRVDLRIGQRAFRIAAADRFQLVQRDLRFNHVTAVCHRRLNDQPIRSVVSRVDVNSRRDRLRRCDAFSDQILADVGGDLVRGWSLLIPDEWQVTREQNRRRRQPLGVAARNDDRRVARRPERRDEAVTRLEPARANRLRTRTCIGRRASADVDGRSFCLAAYFPLLHPVSAAASADSSPMSRTRDGRRHPRQLPYPRWTDAPRARGARRRSRWRHRRSDPETRRRAQRNHRATPLSPQRTCRCF